MPPQTPRRLTLLAPELVLVAGLKLIRALPSVLASLPVDKDARGVAAKDALRALNQVDAIVGAGRADVVLQHDRPPLGGFDEGGVVIAAPVHLLPARVVSREVFLPVGLKPAVPRT